MPVKLLANNPFCEPARLVYEPSPSPAMRTYRWKRPLGVLPHHLRSTATSNTPRAPGHVGRSHNQGRSSDVRQIFSMTQAATEQLKAVAQQGYREESRSCDLDAYRLGTPPYGVNNNKNSANHAGQKSSCKTQLPNIKSDEGSRPGFERRLGRQTYSRTEVLLKLQKRKKFMTGRQVSSGGAVDVGGGQRQDLPVINTKESSPCAACSCDASYIARVATNYGSDSGCHSEDSSGAKSQKSPYKGRRVNSTSRVSKIPQTSERGGSSASPCRSADKGGSHNSSAGPREESKWEASKYSRRKPVFVEVATPLHKDRESSQDTEERSTGTSSPVVSNDADSVCEELHKIVLRRAKYDSTCATPPFGVRWREDNDDSPGSDVSDKIRLDRAMQSLQPPVPYVVWPENKYYSPHTVFVYGSPSRLAPVVIPSHSVDCPQCKFYQASLTGDICPPNSPTPWMQKEYGFYPVERHF